MTKEQEDHEKLMKFFGEAEEWICDCGKRCNPSDSAWGFNGRDWEHNHGGQCGHFAATRSGKALCKEWDLIVRLIAALESVCLECDGIPTELWETYTEAKSFCRESNIGNETQARRQE